MVVRPEKVLYEPEAHEFEHGRADVDDHGGHVGRPYALVPVTREVPELSIEKPSIVLMPRNEVDARPHEQNQQRAIKVQGLRVAADVRRDACDGLEADEVAFVVDEVGEEDVDGDDDGAEDGVDVLCPIQEVVDLAAALLNKFSLFNFGGVEVCVDEMIG